MIFWFLAEEPVLSLILRATVRVQSANSFVALDQKDPWLVFCVLLGNAVSLWLI